jgi:formylglycine-generating enzyme required for sulfatase activity
MSLVGARITKAMLDRLREIPLDQAIEEAELFPELNGDQETKDAANDVVAARLARAFRDSIKKASYESAFKKYEAIAARDASEASRLSNVWVAALKSDYEAFTSSLISQLPPAVMRDFARTALVKFSAEEIAKVPSLENSVGMELKILPPGTFIMGNQKSQDARDRLHQVTLTQPFMIGVHEVTVKQFRAVMGETESIDEHDAPLPVNVSWEGASNFCKILSEMPGERRAGRVYRLPSEAEWEYACRGGTSNTHFFDGGIDSLALYAWFDRTASGRKRPVGQKLANPCGLYDMYGNVQEWCQDWFGYYPLGSVIDPAGPLVGVDRVVRGGASNSYADSCGSWVRGQGQPTRVSGETGFRVAVSLVDVTNSD